MIAIPSPELEKIREHARRAYPNECCGALFGKEDSQSKLVREGRPLENMRHDSPRNRFLVTADDFRDCERYARERGVEILGFYHSHPDHPARPSDYDLEHAWPWLSYVIVAIDKGEPGEITSWEMAEDRSVMRQERLEAVCEKTFTTDEHGGGKRR